MKPSLLHPNTCALIDAWRRIETDLDEYQTTGPRADDNAQLISTCSSSNFAMMAPGRYRVPVHRCPACWDAAR